jgi:hypothetical protein
MEIVSRRGAGRSIDGDRHRPRSESRCPNLRRLRLRPALIREGEQTSAEGAGPRAVAEPPVLQDRRGVSAGAHGSSHQLVCDLYHGWTGKKPAKNRPNETILPKPRNHPETHVAYLFRQRRTSKASGRHQMNHSIHSADRATHLKVVVVALVAGIAVAAFGIAARTGADYSQTAQVVKAGKPVVVTSSSTSTVR